MSEDSDVCSVRRLRLHVQVFEGFVLNVFICVVSEAFLAIRVLALERIATGIPCVG